MSDSRAFQACFWCSNCHSQNCNDDSHTLPLIIQYITAIYHFQKVNVHVSYISCLQAAILNFKPYFINLCEKNSEKIIRCTLFHEIILKVANV